MLWCTTASSAFLLVCRASGELDGHTGDAPGGDGVPAEVSRGNDGGAAQRGGAICGRCQENSCHGERQGCNSVTRDVDLLKTLRVFKFIHLKFLNKIKTVENEMRIL